MSDRLFWRGACILLLFAVGCQTQTSCPAGGPACGGDPVGAWNVVDACRDPVFAPPQQATYAGQPVETARQPNPILASSDWCSSLFVSASTTAFTFPHDTLGVSGGQVTYNADNTYQAEIDTKGPGGIDVSAACLTRSGVSLGCDAVTAALNMVAATARRDPRVPCSDVPSEPAGCQFYFSYQDIACASDEHQGCACTYTVSFAGLFKGQWSVTGSRLVQFDASKMLPTQADFCVAAGETTLSLAGHDRTSLFDIPGILTLELQKAP